MLELAPHLHAALEAGQTLVVPTAQRAAALRLGFATAQLAAGHRAFHTPQVHSLSAWLRAQRLGSPGQRARRPLSSSAEWLLWQEAVTQAAAQLSLPHVAGLVDAVRRSAAVLFEWRIAPSALTPAATPEAALLAESLRRIEARLRELSAVGSWQTLGELALEPPRRVPWFAGFDGQTPARRALLAAWERRGSPSEEVGCEFAPAPAAMAHAADRAQELGLAAQWCRERLLARPEARLLVIVPELAQRRAEVQRLFDAALGADTEAYALEGGQALLAYAPVAAGLATLRVLTAPVEFSQLSQWLRDGFWPQAAPAARAQLEVWLRTVVPPRLEVRQLLRALRAAPPTLLAHADTVAGAIERMLEALGGAPRVTLSQWCERFGRVFALCDLTAAAARQRHSHTQQVLQRLDELLQECAALPAPSVCERTGALELFTQLLAHTRFEPATGDAAVTLTATLADPILRYDGIWVSGLHSGALPRPMQLDPFIPASLQRQAGIIAADATLRVNQARAALATLCRCSREFVVSAPRQEADLKLTASPLLAPYAGHPYAPAAHSDVPWPRAIRAARVIESYVDEPAAPWPAQVPLPAGTRAIELQSRCPFRAYAQLRLAADPLETPAPGITARERGSLLHRALQLLWQRLGGASGLGAARAAQSLEPCIRDCVAQSAEEILQATDEDPAADATGLWELRRAAIVRERGRAERLIRALCELEAQRPPFTVHDLEAEHRLSIAGALIQVRIDRMDELQDGAHLIIDYKSGRAMVPDWEVAHSTHPQLLVYLLASPVPVNALAVAHLDPRSVQFTGIGDQPGRLPGLSALAGDASWAQQQRLWRTQVEQLAADFLRGEARVDPQDGACDYCHLQAFCRIADTP